MHDSLQVCTLCPDGMGRWDDLVRSSDQGTLFMRSEFIKALFGPQMPNLLPLVFQDDGRVVGGVMLRDMSRWGFRAFRSPPDTFGKYGGPLVVHSTAKDIRHTEKLAAGVLANVDRYVAGQRAQFASLVLHWQAYDVRPLLARGWHPRILYTYLLPLGTRDQLWSRLDQKLRNIIRKAEKGGLAVEADPDEDAFYELWQTTMRRAGRAAPISRPVFRRVMQAVRSMNAGRIYITCLPTGEAVAGVVILWDDRRAYYWLGASADGQGDGATSLALWTAIQDMRAEVPEMDLLGANIPSIAFFKAQFNPVLTSYFELRKQSGLGAIAETLYSRSVPRLKQVLKGQLPELEN